MPRSQIRPFAADDIPQVAELHRSVFAIADTMSPAIFQAYRAYFEEVFLDPVAGHEEIGSLVCEEDRRITGFLGSVPRRMSMCGRLVMARIATQFVVNPRNRGASGFKLAQTFFAGPQDFAIADESNGPARILWSALGGVTCSVHSILWCYPLRPCSFGLYALHKFRGMKLPFARIGSPLARGLDAILLRTRLIPQPEADPDSIGRDLDLGTHHACIQDMITTTLRPCYDADSLAWVMRRANQVKTNRDLEKIAVSNEKGQTIGWYILCLTRDGISEVLQFHAKNGSSQRVFKHLLNRARQSGAIAVSGRLDHNLMEPVAEARCMMHSGPWVLVHSRDPEFTRVLQRGDAFFSRLEGEWCTRFQ
jgi:hypothetical protein